MNVALRRAWTVSEYLAWGATQAEGQRAELINGQVVAMSPERADHNRTKARVYATLAAAIRSAGLPCEVFTDGMTVPIDLHTAYDPDAVVHCGPPIPPDQVTVPAPVIVVEVLSPSTAHTDTSAKLVGYFKVPSVRRYLIVDPEARTVVHYSRSPTGAIGAQTLATGDLWLDPPALKFAVADLFRS